MKRTTLILLTAIFSLILLNQNLEFKTETDKDFVFTNGSTFIKDAFEGLILKSPDGQCWKGTADNNGSFVL